jgi:hypothetical protein
MDSLARAPSRVWSAGCKDGSLYSNESNPPPPVDAEPPCPQGVAPYPSAGAGTHDGRDVLRALQRSGSGSSGDGSDWSRDGECVMSAGDETCVDWAVPLESQICFSGHG